MVTHCWENVDGILEDVSIWHKQLFDAKVLTEILLYQKLRYSWNILL